jgi:hypothetical protein
MKVDNAGDGRDYSPRDCRLPARTPTDQRTAFARQPRRTCHPACHGQRAPAMNLTECLLFVRLNERFSWAMERHIYASLSTKIDNDVGSPREGVCVGAWGAEN